MQSLDVISTNLWQILISLCNLLLLFLILKRFLYKPVKRVMAERKAMLDKQYAAAEEAQESALNLKQEYEEHLKNAKEEANELLRSATKKAQLRSEEILAEAQQKSAGLLKRAEEQIEHEKKQAVNEIKNEISDMAILAAEKVMEKELNQAEHERLIEDFIDRTENLQ